jgi:hypothetical protein
VFFQLTADVKLRQLRQLSDGMGSTIAPGRAHFEAPGATVGRSLLPARQPPLPVSPSCAAGKAPRQPDCSLRVSGKDRESRDETTEKHALPYHAPPPNARAAG